MQRILSKRVLRDIRENLLRYLALFFLVALVMYMVVAIVGAAETIMQGTKESGRVHHREDGQFGVFVPLTEKETAQITEKGVTLQRIFPGFSSGTVHVSCLSGKRIGRSVRSSRRGGNSGTGRDPVGTALCGKT